MKFLIDEALGLPLAKALRELGQEDVHHVTEILRSGADDEEVFQYAGENEYFIITRDNRIRYKPNERAAIRKYKVGVFLLAGKNKSAMEIAVQLISNWEKIVECSQKTYKPFLRRVRSRGTKIEELDLY